MLRYVTKCLATRLSLSTIIVDVTNKLAVVKYGKFVSATVAVKNFQQLIVWRIANIVLLSVSARLSKQKWI